MAGPAITRFLNPWKFRREQEEQRVAELRRRDGDTCKRCKRPIRFDLTPGHDLGPKVEAILSVPTGAAVALDNLCLCHGRCNAKSGDDTNEVAERARRKSEAELFVKSRKKRKAA